MNDASMLLEKRVKKTKKEKKKKRIYD